MVSCPPSADPQKNQSRREENGTDSDYMGNRIKQKYSRWKDILDKNISVHVMHVIKH